MDSSRKIIAIAGAALIAALAVPGPQAQAAPAAKGRVTKVAVVAKPAAYRGAAPAHITFRGTIFVTHPPV